MDNLLSHVAEKSFQSLFNSLLVIQSAAQQEPFELLINERNCGGPADRQRELEIGGAAGVQVLLTFLPLDDRIGESNDLVDQVVYGVEGVDL